MGEVDQRINRLAGKQLGQAALGVAIKPEHDWLQASGLAALDQFIQLAGQHVADHARVNQKGDTTFDSALALICPNEVVAQ